MKNEKIGKFVFYVLFISFLVLYFSSLTGYYEYQNHQKTNLTANEIKKFEQDIKEGKDIDIQDYLATEITYSNSFSKLTSTLSEKISEFTTTGINESFKYLSKMMDS